MHNTFRTILSLVLVLVFCISLLPAGALAEDVLPPDEEEIVGDAVPAVEPLPEAIPNTLEEEEENSDPEPAGEEAEQEPEPAEPLDEENAEAGLPANDPPQDPSPAEEGEGPSEPQQPEPQVIPPEEETTEPESPMQESLEEEPEEEEHIHIVVEPETYKVELDASGQTEGLFEGYANKVLYGSRLRSAGPGSSAGARLTGFDSTVYNALLAQIKLAAAGSRTSTRFEFSLADLGILQTEWTAAELGVSSLVDDSGIAPEAKAALNAMFEMNICSIFSALLYDCPYELYWFDKTAPFWADGYYYGVYWKEEIEDYVMFVEGGYTFPFTVVEEYRASPDSPYEIDPSSGAAVQAARGRALSIVGNNSGLSNAAKLYAYKEAIRELSDYNFGAAYEGTFEYDYGNPWQLIWVFDGDPSTTVVCEGFAKAFQYLCELSTFTGSVSCISVDGGMDNGAHMWNVVTMEDGKNYLCDVTNCSTGNAGPAGYLFLEGCDSGNVQDGYSVNGNEYIYSYLSFDFFPVERLALSDSDYVSPTGPVNVSINKTELDLFVNQTYTLRITDGNGYTQDVNWESSNTSIATVTGAGKVKAVKSGTAVIRTKDNAGNVLGTCAVRVLFSDVADSSRYFYEPVYWALDNGITTGAGGAGLFSPDADCTREQIVTFLWRLMDEPEPTVYTSFTDVPENAWYYKPICWAAEQGITVGLNDGTGRFGVGQPCTRAMCVTFLWRAAGKPAPATQGNFTDLKPGAYYVDAVSWAAENGITVGLNDGTGRFGINNSCTRAMIVTFLYRFAHMG